MGKYEPIDTWEKSKSFSKEINVNDLIVAELEKIKAEITEYRNNINAGSDEFHIGRLFGCDEIVEIIDKHISELKGSE